MDLLEYACTAALLLALLEGLEIHLRALATLILLYVQQRWGSPEQMILLAGLGAAITVIAAISARSPSISNRSLPDLPRRSRLR